MMNDARIHLIMTCLGSSLLFLALPAVAGVAPKEPMPAPSSRLAALLFPDAGDMPEAGTRNQLQGGILDADWHKIADALTTAPEPSGLSSACREIRTCHGTRIPAHHRYLAALSLLAINANNSAEKLLYYPAVERDYTVKEWLSWTQELESLFPHKVCDKNQASHLSQFLLADAYARTSDHARARQILQNLVNDPNCPARIRYVALNSLGVIRWLEETATGKSVSDETLGQAIRDLEESAQQSARVIGRVIADPWLNQGVIHLYGGSQNTDLAKKAFQRALTSDPFCAMAHNGSTVAAAIQGKRQEVLLQTLGKAADEDGCQPTLVVANRIMLEGKEVPVQGITDAAGIAMLRVKPDWAAAAIVTGQLVGLAGKTMISFQNWKDSKTVGMFGQMSVDAGKLITKVGGVYCKVTIGDVQVPIMTWLASNYPGARTEVSPAKVEPVN
jgi:tetratricopeptide (TPR) repeat protein